LDSNNKNIFHYRLFYFIFTAVIIFLFLPLKSAVPENLCFFCRQKSGIFKIEMSVSQNLQEVFVPLTKDFYPYGELGKVFSDMDTYSNLYCSMRRRMHTYDREEAKAFIQTDFLDRYRKSFMGSLEDLKAGCWNFFEMNDFRPDLDFQLVKQLYPNREFDCYSVGFLQPYIMQSILSCKSLSMVDINWRILDAHYDFIHYFKQQKNAMHSIESMTFNWFALDLKPQKQKNGTVSLLCRDVQLSDCRKYLKDFDRHLHFPEKVFLQLTHLSMTQFQKIKKNTMRVFFLSNAIEEMYTSPEEYRMLMDRTAASLKTGQRALFIHHVGGWKLFGIYEMEKINKSGEYSLKTVCKDQYKSVLRSADETPAVYLTYFDKESAEVNPNTCYSLLSEK